MLITNLTSQDYWFGPLHLTAFAVNFAVDDTTATSLYLTDDGVADAINTLYTASPPKITVTGAAAPFPRATGEPTILHGDGSPEGLIYAGQGSVYLRRDNTGGAELYQKTTGIHVNTGWVSFAGSVVTTPTGALHMYGGAAAPTGWLMCDGAAVSRATYADLFAAIGSAFGDGDHSTTFNVPDFRGRVGVGKGTPVGVDTLGASDQLPVGQRRPQHRHTPHTHAPVGGGQFLATSGSDNLATAGGGTKFGTVAGADGGSGNANDSLDAPAYLVVNYIIKT